MSLDNTLRTLIREEITLQLQPLQDLVAMLNPVREWMAELLPYSAKGGSSSRARAGRVPAGKRACAIIGCPRASRSKGYCAAHYQKLRNLIRTQRRPAAWKDDAGPASVPDVVLPRGRAAAKALKASRAGRRRRAA